MSSNDNDNDNVNYDEDFDYFKKKVYIFYYLKTGQTYKIKHGKVFHVSYFDDRIQYKIQCKDHNVDVIYYKLTERTVVLDDHSHSYVDVDIMTESTLVIALISAITGFALVLTTIIFVLPFLLKWLLILLLA